MLKKENNFLPSFNSSQIIKSALMSDLIALRVISSGLPIGVETIESVPGFI